MTHTKVLFFSLYISAATLHNNAVAAAKLAAQTTGSVPTAGKVTLSGIKYSQTQRQAMKTQTY